MDAERERRFRSEGPDRTEALAEALGERMPPGAVVALLGELGAGKTCFVRGLARGLGVEEAVSSPTFTLMHSYRGRLPLYHYDAWMEQRERAFLSSGGEEWMHGGGVAVIEWAERVSSLLPAERLEVTLEHASPSERRIRLAVLGQGPLADALAGALQALPGELDAEPHGE